MLSFVSRSSDFQLSGCFVDGVGVVVSVEALFGVAGDVLAKIPPDKADMMKHAASELENLYTIMADAETRKMSEAQTQEYVGVFRLLASQAQHRRPPRAFWETPAMAGHGWPWPGSPKMPWGAFRKQGQKRIPHVTSYVRHCILYQRSGGLCAPKHHFGLHMGHNIRLVGSPMHCSTYVDEGLNGTLAGIAATAHRSTFADTVFAKYRYSECQFCD